MKHPYSFITRFSLTALFLLLGSTAFGQIWLGYCGDKISTNGLSNSNLDAEISCAMVLTPQRLTEYTICSLNELQIGLSETEGLTSLKVWVRHHLTDEENLASAELPVSELQVGWNSIQLDGQVSITGEDSLYCGYTYTQDAKVKCISYNGPKKTPNSFFISNGTMWGDYTKNYGPVCIRAGVMPLFDNAIKLTDLRLDRRSQLFREPGAEYAPITISGTIQNVGCLPLTSLRVTCTDNGSTPEYVAFETEGATFGESTAFSFQTMPGRNVTAPACDIPLLISVNNPNGDTDATLIDCEQTLYYELGNSSCMPDMAEYIIEEFTSEECGYAPIGQQHLREAIDKAHRINLGDRYQAWLDGEIDGYYTHYTILSRHEGYGPADYWRLDRGSDYKPAIFGPKELSFAPAMVVNRSQIPSSTALPSDSLAAIIAGYQQSNVVSLLIDRESLTYDEARRKLSISMKAVLWSSAFCLEPYVMLCVKQDLAESYDQKNYYPEKYSSEYQTDAICCFLGCTSGSNDLFPKTDLSNIMSGRTPIGDLLERDEEGNVCRTFTFEGVLPNDIQSLEGLTLVGYVADRQPGGRIYGATSCELIK